MNETIEISGIWLKATTDPDGRETIAVEVEIDGRWVTVLREAGGGVAQQDNGANISHAVSAGGMHAAIAQDAQE